MSQVQEAMDALEKAAANLSAALLHEPGEAEEVRTRILMTHMRTTEAYGEAKLTADRIRRERIAAHERRSQEKTDVHA